jgi:hypothetical protein
MLASTISSLAVPTPGGSATIFAKSLPVFVCSRCDQAPDPQQPTDREDVVY